MLNDADAETPAGTSADDDIRAASSTTSANITAACRQGDTSRPWPFAPSRSRLHRTIERRRHWRRGHARLGVRASTRASHERIGDRRRLIGTEQVISAKASHAIAVVAGLHVR
jgi:hypothetical protein